MTLLVVCILFAALLSAATGWHINSAIKYREDHAKARISWAFAICYGALTLLYVFFIYVAATT